MIRNVVHPSHIQHMGPQAATAHHMSNISQQHQQSQAPHMNMSTVQQQHMMHTQPNYHQNR